MEVGIEERQTILQKNSGTRLVPLCNPCGVRSEEEGACLLKYNTYITCKTFSERSDAQLVYAELRIGDILVSDPDPCLRVMDPDPAIFVIDFQDTNKRTSFLKKLFCLLLFKCTFTSFFKGKKFKRSHETIEIKVFLTNFA